MIYRVITTEFRFTIKSAQTKFDSNNTVQNYFVLNPSTIWPEKIQWGDSTLIDVASVGETKAHKQFASEFADPIATQFNDTKNNKGKLFLVERYIGAFSLTYLPTYRSNVRAMLVQLSAREICSNAHSPNTTQTCLLLIPTMYEKFNCLARKHRVLYPDASTIRSLNNANLKASH